jgi:hypothetical protein
MKYLIAIALGALAIGLLLNVAIYHLFDSNLGYFFASFIAVPAGLICFFLLFIAYDTLWPKKGGKK